jgi:hypothetical protein
MASWLDVPEPLHQSFVFPAAVCPRCKLQQPLPKCRIQSCMLRSRLVASLLDQVLIRAKSYILHENSVHDLRVPRAVRTIRTRTPSSPPTGGHASYLAHSKKRSRRQTWPAITPRSNKIGVSRKFQARQLALRQSGGAGRDQRVTGHRLKSNEINDRFPTRTESMAQFNPMQSMTYM